MLAATAFPKVTVLQATPGNTSWHQFTGFPINLGTTVAPIYPQFGAMNIRTATAAGGDGGAVWIEFNLASAPSDTSAARLISGNGQTVSYPIGQENLWYKLVTGTDTLIVEIMY